MSHVDSIKSASPVTRRLLALGAAAGPCYVVVSLAQALTRDGFDVTRHAWSMLANGSLGWIQIANLIGSGLLVIAGAVGLHRALAPSRGGRWAARLLAGYGLGLVAGGIFRADPGQGFPPGTPETVQMSWHGALHFVFAGIGFLCLVAACFVLARRFAADRRRGWAAFSRVTGVVFLVGFGALAGSGGQSWAVLAFVAAVLVASAWICLVSLYHHRRLPAAKIQ